MMVSTGCRDMMASAAICHCRCDFPSDGARYVLNGCSAAGACSSNACMLDTPTLDTRGAEPSRVLYPRAEAPTHNAFVVMMSCQAFSLMLLLPEKPPPDVCIRNPGPCPNWA